MEDRPGSNRKKYGPRNDRHNGRVRKSRVPLLPFLGPASAKTYPESPFLQGSCIIFITTVSVFFFSTAQNWPTICDASNGLFIQATKHEKGPSPSLVPTIRCNGIPLSLTLSGSKRRHKRPSSLRPHQIQLNRFNASSKAGRREWESAPTAWDATAPIWTE